MDLFSVIKLLCGLSFFLFGMNVMSKNLEKLAGGKLEQTLRKFTSNPVLSMLLGMVITIAVQSSSAVTVMLVGLVNSGIMQFAQTVFVLFGANIGTTLTAWILSLSGLESSAIALQMLKPENFSPILAFVGVIFVLFSNKEKKKNVGTIFVGFAILMYGMVFMTQAVSPLAQSPQFTNVLVKFNNPVFGLLIGIVVTAAIQSSAASIGILQALSLTGSISYGMAAPIIMGQNIGTCVTSLLSCIGTSSKAKRVAVLHTSIKTIGAAICLVVFVLIDKIIAPPLFASAVTPWGVAAIHTVFNIAITVILAPLNKLLVKMIEKLIKDNENEHGKVHLDDILLRTPSVAVKECEIYTVNMIKDAKDALLSAFDIIGNFSEKLAEKITALEKSTDEYEDEISTYLSKVTALSVSNEDSYTVNKMHHALGNFERLGDHAVNILEVARDINKDGITFSDAADKELGVMINALSEIITLTEKAYSENDPSLAGRVEPLEQVIDKLTDEIKARHFDRVSKGECSIDIGFILFDLLNNFSRISDHCSNVAIAVIEANTGSFDAHEYMSRVKHGNAEFDKIFNEFDKQYQLV